MTARDLGRTSADFVDKGVSYANTVAERDQSAAKFAGLLTPSTSSAQSLLFTPQQLLAREDSNASYANAVENKNNQIQYQNGLMNAQASSINPLASGAITGFGQLAQQAPSIYRQFSAGANAGGTSGGAPVSATVGTPYDIQYNPTAYTQPYYNSFESSPYLSASNYDTGGSYVGPYYGG